MRQEFSRKTRAEAFLRAGGICETKGCARKAYHCDHIIPDSIGGKNDLANAQILCRDCHAEKTNRIDIPRAAKTKRQARKHNGTWRLSRNPMPGSRRSRWRRKISGEVVLR